MGHGLSLGASPFSIHFPIFLVGVWLFASLFVGLLSSWFQLAHHYPNRHETAHRVLRFCSARVGACDLVGCLRFEPCPTGLRIAMARAMGPLQRPIFVPWSHITVHAARDNIVLYLGGVGTATVSHQLAMQLAAAAFQTWNGAAVLLAHPVQEAVIGPVIEDPIMIAEVHPEGARSESFEYRV